MTLPDSTTLTLVGAVMGLWLVVASWAIVRGLMMQRRAAFAARRGAQLSALLDVAPAMPLLVRGDGRIEGPGAIATLFGLEALPRTLDGLGAAGDSGLNEADFAQLSAQTRAAQRTGKAFRLSLRSADGRRSLSIRGAPVPPALGGADSALLWLSDTSEDAARNMALLQQRADAIAAFDAVSIMIEAAPFPMWFRDENCQLLLVNAAYVDASEASDAQDVITNQIELIEPVAGISGRDSARQAAERGEAIERVIPVTVSGKRRMTRVVDIPIKGAGIAGYAIDRQELDDLRQEYRRFAEARRSMLDQMSAGVAEFGPDRSLTFVNRPFLRLFQIDDEWAASAPPFERVLDRMRDAGRTPEVRDFPSWRAERRGWFAVAEMQEESWLLRDGTHLRTVAQPTPDGGLLLIFEDRTEQIQLASARDTLLRVRTATFDNLYEAVAVFSPDGRLHLWNQRFRRLWDLSEEYLVGHPRLDALLAKVSPSLKNPRQQNALNQMIVGATSDRQLHSGRIHFADDRQFDYSAIPLPDGNALFTLIDVTDSRRIERALRDRADALEAADKLKTDFLSRISYELRTPLTSIGGFAEMLDKGYAGALPDAAKRYVTAILESTEALGRQIDTVLDLGQSEVGTLPLERRPIAVADLVRDAARAAATQAREAGVDVTLDLRAGMGQISGDARRLRQALDQVIQSSLGNFADPQFQPAGGRRMLIHGDGDALAAQIIISDNGPGLPMEGTRAVGLALARQLVSAHHGRFDQAARAGEGAMTTMFLPR